MTNFRTSTESRVISKTRIEFNTGVVTMEEVERTDTFQDGSVKVYSVYMKEDDRIHTKLGHIYAEYKTKASFNASIRRLQKQADSEYKKY